MGAFPDYSTSSINPFLRYHIFCHNDIFQFCYLSGSNVSAAHRKHFNNGTLNIVGASTTWVDDDGLSSCFQLPDDQLYECCHGVSFFEGHSLISSTTLSRPPPPATLISVNCNWLRLYPSYGRTVLSETGSSDAIRMFSFYVGSSQEDVQGPPFQAQLTNYHFPLPPSLLYRLSWKSRHWDRSKNCLSRFFRTSKAWVIV